MEILNLRKKVFFILFTALFLIDASGQDFKSFVEAFQKSYLAEASGEYNKAIMALKSVYNEKSYEINLRLGWLSYEAGSFTESIAYYNKAIGLMPYAVEPKFGIVYPASALGNWTQIINQYQQILDITPNNTVAMHRLGLIYYGREDFQKAENYFSKVVNLFPFDYDALTMLAWTKLKLKKFREAKVLFQKAILNTPNGPSATEGMELLK